MRVRPFTPLILALLGAPALAAPRHQDVTGPGGFAHACAAPSTPGAPRTPGIDISGDFASGNCQVQTFTGNATAATSASHASLGEYGAIGNASGGSAGVGHLHLRAHNASPTATFFAGAASSAGFEDRLTLSLPGQEGQTVYMLVAMSADGHLATQGGSNRFRVTGYVNHNELMANHPGFSRGNSDAFTTDRQRVGWGLSGGPDLSRDIEGFWTFSVPVVVGTSFDFGVYANAYASQGSVGPPLNNSQVSAQLDFSHTLRVQGVTGLWVGGSLVTEGYTLSAASGLDWTQPLPVPEPGSALLLAGGLALLARRRSGASRSSRSGS